MFYRRIDDHLCLKLISVLDADDYFAVVDRNRDDLARWFEWVETTKTVADLRPYLESCGAGWGTMHNVATLLVLDGEVIGSIDLHRIDCAARKCEIGYWLDAKHRGHGYMTRAVREIEKLAFEDLNMNRVAIHAETRNAKSRAIPERLGYHLDGIWRSEHLAADGSLQDGAIYSLLRDEWADRR